jgi:hypothetical protein
LEARNGFYQQVSCNKVINLKTKYSLPNIVLLCFNFRYHGTHALRERANKLHLGILIIRFEMPYNIWCEGCPDKSIPIGMGVRSVHTQILVH